MRYYKKRPSKLKNFFKYIVYLILAVAISTYFFPEYFKKYSEFLVYDYTQKNNPIEEVKITPEVKVNPEVKIHNPIATIENKVFTNSNLYLKEYLNVVYTTVDITPEQKKDLTLNIYKPENTNTKTPVVVFIPGKNFSLNKDESLNSPLYKGVKSLTAKGITVINLDYRDLSLGVFPAQIADIKKAIKFLKDNSEKYGLDENRFAVLGENTGGTFAQLLGATAANTEFEKVSVNYVVTFGAPTDMINLFPDSEDKYIPKDKAYVTFDAADSIYGKIINFSSEKWMGMAGIRRMQKKGKSESSAYYWNRVDLAELLSPIYSVSKETAPMFIVHNMNDKEIPVKQSIRLSSKLSESQVENILISNYSNSEGYTDENIINLSLDWLTTKLSK